MALEASRDAAGGVVTANATTAVAVRHNGDGAPPPPPPSATTTTTATTSGDERRSDASVSLLTERLSQLMRDNKALRTDVAALSAHNHALAYERAQQQKQLVDAIASAQNFRSLSRTTQAEYETQLRAWSECADNAERTHQGAIRTLQEALASPPNRRSGGSNNKRNNNNSNNSKDVPSTEDLVQENRLLKERNAVCQESHQIREQLSAATLRHTQLRYQLLEHKMYQQQRQSAAENAKNRHYLEQIDALTKTEAELRSQLALYAEKFEQFQETLTKSNDVFSTFKQEMERMSDTIKKNEKENELLRSKRDQTDVALIDLAEERNRYKKQVEVTKQQKNTLEDLCRVLQNERKDWRAQQKKQKQAQEEQEQQQTQSQSQSQSQTHPPPQQQPPRQQPQRQPQRPPQQQQQQAEAGSGSQQQQQQPAAPK
jgi:Myosin-like coiled-coil protein